MKQMFEMENLTVFDYFENQKIEFLSLWLLLFMLLGNIELNKKWVTGLLTSF